MRGGERASHRPNLDHPGNASSHLRSPHSASRGRAENGRQSPTCQSTKAAKAETDLQRRVCHHFGLRSTRMTESPRRNILLMKRSLFTGLAFFLLPCGTSVHISRTFSRTMLEWRSKALTRARIFLLFRQLMSTCELSFTHFCSTESGPTSKLSLSSGFASSIAVHRNRSLCWSAQAEM